MVTFTLFFTLGVWLIQQQPQLPDPTLGWVLAFAPLALFIRGKTPATALSKLMLIAVCGFGLGAYQATWQAKLRLSETLPALWQGRDIQIQGVIASLPHKNERGYRFHFDIEKTLTPEVSVPAHIYLATYFNPKTVALTPHAGERWQFTVRLKQVHGGSNPGAFDFELWALENDIRAAGYVYQSTPGATRRAKTADPPAIPAINQRLDNRADGFLYRIEAWREAVRDKFDQTLGAAPYKGVLTALAVGDQDSIPQDQWQIYTRTGINHLMSISGLHITMLSSLGFALTFALWRQSTILTLWLPARKAAAISACLVAAGYALLSGYGVPAQRTLYMVTTAAAALWLGRNFSLSQIMCMALLLVLLNDPWAVLSPGFWLSFGAVGLILYVSSHRIEKQDARGWLARTLREYATVQWAMCIGLIPLLLCLFGQVSLVSPIANAFAIPLVSFIVVPLALLGAALPSEVPLWLAHISMDLTMIPLQYLSQLPGAVWIQHTPPAWCIVLGTIGALCILLPAGFYSRTPGFMLMLPMFLNSPEPPAPNTARITIFDVGQGLSVAIQTRNHAMLYDTGPDFSRDADSGNRILVPSLRTAGIRRLDGILLSHDDTDHTGGTASVVQAMPADWILTPVPLQDFKTVKPMPLQNRPCKDGLHWNWDGIQFDILHPDIEYVNDNESSCVLRVSCGNQHILLAGDIEKHSEQRLLNLHANELAANLLIVPHHGSLNSSHLDFVSAVLPDYAVFTTGYRNPFNHPRIEIRQRYADSGAILLRSDEDGAILVQMNDQNLQLERYRKTHKRYWTHQTAP